MAKDRAQYGTTNQVAVAQRKTQTCAIYCGIGLAPVEQFAELIQGKILVSMNDFTNGTGDRAVKVKVNLDISEAKWIYEHAKNAYMPEPVSGCKIYGNNPYQGGTDKLPDGRTLNLAGYCNVFRYHISRSGGRNDGQPQKYPWVMEISNGYGMTNQYENGAFSLKSGTFVEKGRVRMSFGDVEFFGMFDAVNRYIETFTEVAGNVLIPVGLQEMAKNAGNQFADRYSLVPRFQQEDRRYEPVQHTAPAREASKPVANATPVPSKPIKGYPVGSMVYPVTIIKDHWSGSADGTAIAECIVHGKTQDHRQELHFDIITSEMKDAEVSESRIDLVIYRGVNGEYHVWGLPVAA